MYLEIQVLGGFPEIERRNSAVLRHREIQFFATSAIKSPHFDGPRFRRRGRADLSADRMARYRSAGSTDSGIPGRDGWFRGARNRGFPHQIPPFYGPEMTDFGRFPGFRISDAPPMYSPVLMYLEIQVFAGFPELKIATFANTFRCFEISGNPGFGRFPGARNRDFRDEVPPF